MKWKVPASKPLVKLSLVMLRNSHCDFTLVIVCNPASTIVVIIMVCLVTSIEW
jgi:hypothetical protein